jgi:hypothetical protein
MLGDNVEHIEQRAALDRQPVRQVLGGSKECRPIEVTRIEIKLTYVASASPSSRSWVFSRRERERMECYFAQKVLQNHERHYRSWG